MKKRSDAKAKKEHTEEIVSAPEERLDLSVVEKEFDPFGTDEDIPEAEIEEMIAEIEDVIAEEDIVFGGDEQEDRGDDAEDEGETDQPEEVVGRVASVPTLPISTKDAFYVPRERRLTQNVMTTFEFAECISIRATELSQDKTCYAKTAHEDPIKMAVAEIQQQRCPLTLNRQVGFRDVDGFRVPVYEQWDVCEMTIREIPAAFQ